MSNEFATRLRIARCWAGMSQAGAALALGVGRTQYRCLEDGLSLPAYGTVEKLCVMLKVTPNYLFGVKE